MLVVVHVCDFLFSFERVIDLFFFNHRKAVHHDLHLEFYVPVFFYFSIKHSGLYHGVCYSGILFMIMVAHV